MTHEQLIAEGRNLERPCVFLRPTGIGPIAAVWYERDENEVETSGHRLWLTVDARHIPGLAVSGYVNVFTDEAKRAGGRVEVMSSWPKRAGASLYAHPVSVLPPIDAVFAKGSPAVGEWIASHSWSRRARYNDNFKDRANRGAI